MGANEHHLEPQNRWNHIWLETPGEWGTRCILLCPERGGWAGHFDWFGLPRGVLLSGGGVVPCSQEAITPPKFNIAPEKWWLEDCFPFWMAYFQGRTVKLPGSRAVENMFFFQHTEQLFLHSGCQEETSVETSRAIEAGGMWSTLNYPSLMKKLFVWSRNQATCAQRC